MSMERPELNAAKRGATINCIALAVFLAAACAAFGGSTNINLTWDPSPDDTGTNGVSYRLYWGTGSAARTYHTNFGIGTGPTYAFLVTGLGTNRFALTAVSLGGIESDKSDEFVVAVIKPRPPALVMYNLTVIR